jgi:hypothetical protein
LAIIHVGRVELLEVGLADRAERDAHPVEHGCAIIARPRA